MVPDLQGEGQMDRRIVCEHANGLRQILGLWNTLGLLPTTLHGVNLIDHIGDVTLALVGDRHVLYREFVAPIPTAVLSTQ